MNTRSALFFRKTSAVMLAAALLTSGAFVSAAMDPGNGFGITANAEVGYTPYSSFYFSSTEDGMVVSGFSGSETEVYIPEQYYGTPVVGIGESAFNGNSTITAVTIPACIKYIGNTAFYECTSLEQVNAEGYSGDIGFGAFYGTPWIDAQNDAVFVGNVLCACKSQYDSNTGYIVPEGTTVIASEAFSWCKWLSSVKIPDSVTGIGSRAFFNCPPMKKVMIPSSVKSIGNEAFGYYFDSNGFQTLPVEGFTIVGVSGSAAEDYAKENSFAFEEYVPGETPAEYFNTIENSDGTLTVVGYTGLDTDVSVPPYINGKAVISIASNTFRFSPVEVEAVTLPETLKTIEAYAFTDMEKLSSVTLAQGIESIGELAFSDCTALKELNVPGSLTSISHAAFIRSGLENYYVDESNPVYSSENGILLNKTKDTLVTYPAGRKIVTGIPSGVTTIGYRAFFPCRSITSVMLPDTIETLESEAFSQCNALKTVIVSDSVKTIGSEAFAYCYDLEYIKLPRGLTEIPERMFMLSGDFTAVIPSSVKTIGKHAFAYSSITTAPLPEGVESIGAQAFYSCGSLKNVTIPKSAASVSANAFLNCSKLTSVTLRSATTAIGSHALGFSYSSSDKIWKGITDFTVAAPCDSTGQEYAQSNGFLFSPTDDPLVNESYANAYKLSLGSRVYLTGNARGGTGEITYTYYYKRSTAKNWVLLGTENSSYTSMFVTPKAATEFNFRIVARDSLGKSTEKTFDISIADGKSTAFSNTSGISAELLKPNTRLYLYGSSEGASAPVRYAYYYKRRSASVWRSIGTEFTQTGSVYFKPTAEGEYDVKIDALDAENELVSRVFEVKVTNEESVDTGFLLENRSYLGAQTSAAGQRVELNGDAAGGTTPYRFAYYYRRSGAKVWNVTGTEYGTSKLAYITPKSAGSFDIRIVVMDQSGATAEKLLTLEVK